MQDTLIERHDVSAARFCLGRHKMLPGDVLEMAVAYPQVSSMPLANDPAIPNGSDVPAMSYPGSRERDPCDWYALYVRPRYEKLAAMLLANKGYENLLPLYKCRRRLVDRHKEIQLPVFPGYLFCRFDPKVRLPILTTPGVLHVVGCGRVPMPICELEMEGLRRLADSSLQSEPFPYLTAGQRVYIEKGPLEGTEGILLTVKKTHRLVLSVTLLQRSVAVEIDRDWVRPASAFRPGIVLVPQVA